MNDMEYSQRYFSFSFDMEQMSNFIPFLETLSLIGNLIRHEWTKILTSDDKH